MAQQPLKVFLDCDPLIYSIGFAAQTSYKETIWEEEGGELKQRGWADGNEAREYFKDLKKREVAYEILEETTHVEAEPVENALSMMKVTLKSIQRDIAEHYDRDVFDVPLLLVLTGKGNYREKVSKQRVYKGNRKQERPVHYQALRDYVVKYWKAQIIDGAEADDECSIQARDTGGVVATTDKDLDQIPGRHYDYKKKVFYEVDPYDATVFFYQQCISGDATDNIPGAWKMGIKKAQKIIEEAAAKIYYEWHEDPEDFEKILWEQVVLAYKLYLESRGCPYTREQISEIALETARLVKLQEYDDQLWCPPGVADESVQEYMTND